MLSRILSRLALTVLFFAAWFLVAGRVAWPQAWAFLIVFLISVSTLVWRLARTDPALLRERSQALDSGRFLWLVVPPWAQSIGWVLLDICGTVVWHVSTKNTYLSRYARIQDDREQVVVRVGLYGRVRHSMYFGVILLFCGLPLVLGSWW